MQLSQNKRSAQTDRQVRTPLPLSFKAKGLDQAGLRMDLSEQGNYIEKLEKSQTQFGLEYNAQESVDQNILSQSVVIDLRRPKGPAVNSHVRLGRGEL